jgi:trigger factor
MATVTRESIGPLHEKIVIKLTKEDYLPSFDKALKHYAKSANVPGFRKGMVPAGMVRKMYGQSLFNDEVLRSASSKLDEYMATEKIAIFATPMVLPNEVPIRMDMNAPTDVDFAFEIGLKPDFEVTPLKNRPNLTLYKVTAGNKMIEDEVVRITRRYGKAEEAEVIGSENDIVQATYELCDAAGNVADEPDMVEGNELMEKLPVQLQGMLMGKKTVDTVVFRPADVCTEAELSAFMKDPLKKDVSAANEYYKMTINKVQILVPAALDIALFAEVFPTDDIKDETEFKARIHTELNKEFERVAKDRLQNEIFELLVHETKIELPVPFLKRWMREGGEKRKSEREVEQEFSSFDHQLRWTIISDKLIVENKIQVTKEEIAEDIKTRVLAYFGMTNADDAPWMDGYMDKIAKDEKSMEETYRRLLYAKLFDYLETQFNVVEKEVTEEEFFKLPDAHTAHHHHH